MQLLVEAIGLGVMLMLFLIIMAYIKHVANLSNVQTLALAFVSGVVMHLCFEAVGTNKWYCDNGHACINKQI